jgi:hypothetical protein
VQDTRGPGLDLDRTYLLRRELEWLPPELRAVRWSMWGVSALLAGLGVAVTVASGGALAHLVAVAAAGGAVAGGPLGRSIMRRRLQRLARGQLDMVRLGAEPEGELVHLAGRISLSGPPLRGFLFGVEGVYRRMTLRLWHRSYLHESAVDFDLVDSAGERISVLVQGSRLLVPPPRELVDCPRPMFASQPPPPSLAALMGKHPTRQVAEGRAIPAAEFVLRPGAEVEIVGYKTGKVDPSAGSGIGRSPPMRPALRSGRIPLIITPKPALPGREDDPA